MGLTMDTNLTFKEYLQSKEKLREAVQEIPHQKKEYLVTKYCKLVVGESKDEKEQVNLKPNNKVIVEWLYEDIDSPTVVNITFDGVCEEVDSENHSTYWQSYKLQRWLLRNTEQE
jgi:hypothetical protein